MFVYVLFFIAIASVLFVESNSEKNREKKGDTKENIGSVKGVTSELRTFLDGNTNDRASEERRDLNCTCGVIN